MQAGSRHSVFLGPSACLRSVVSSPDGTQTSLLCAPRRISPTAGAQMSLLEPGETREQ